MPGIFDLVKETKLYKHAVGIASEEERSQIEFLVQVVAARFDHVISQLDEVARDPERGTELREELIRMGRDPQRRSGDTG